MITALLFALALTNVLASNQPQLIPVMSPLVNVTGALNTFMEMRSESDGNSNGNVVQLPPAHQPVIILGPPQPQPQIQIQPQVQPQIQIQPTQQQQPIIDPALQRLLNSFNTVPVDYAHPQQVAYSVATPVNGLPTVISYVTCYVGCSHVTNVVSAANAVKPSFVGLVLASVLIAILI